MRWLGRLLQGVRAGEAHLTWALLGAEAKETIVLTSPAFAHGAPMPKKHAGPRVGDDLSPPLAWSGAPADAAELVLVVEDPDAPIPRPFVHAIAYAIAPGVTSLAEGALSGDAARAPAGFAMGKNSLGKLVYRGPGPVPGHGPHRYVFQIFALARRSSFSSPPRKGALIDAMKGNVLAKGRLDGLYER